MSSAPAELQGRIAASAAAAPCPICGSASHFAFAARDRNRRITTERFAYNRCRTCATVFMVDPPGDLGRYYGPGR